MKSIILAVFVGSLLLPTFSFGISRIGGGKLSSNRSLFEAELSLQYQKVPNGNPKIDLYSMPIGMNGGPMSFSGKLLVAEFADIYPSYVDLEREDIQSIYLGRGYVNVRDSFDAPDCVDIYHQVFEQNTQYVLVWGSGRGFQLTLSKDAQTQVEGLNIIGTLILKDGACAWK